MKNYDLSSIIFGLADEYVVAPAMRQVVCVELIENNYGLEPSFTSGEKQKARQEILRAFSVC
jgi:hypothetical protein